MNKTSNSNNSTNELEFSIVSDEHFNLCFKTPSIAFNKNDNESEYAEIAGGVYTKDQTVLILQGAAYGKMEQFIRYKSRIINFKKLFLSKEDIISEAKNLDNLIMAIEILSDVNKFMIKYMRPEKELLFKYISSELHENVDMKEKMNMQKERYDVEIGNDKLFYRINKKLKSLCIEEKNGKFTYPYAAEFIIEYTKNMNEGQQSKSCFDISPIFPNFGIENVFF
jgi:hypothetical protein